MKKNHESKPLVAIRCITYNHEQYIRDALEGFVMQKTDFPFVAIVHDDASTDGTAAVIREYANKYPDIIKPIYETENQYSKRDGSLRRIMDDACNATGAKYIAFCEGDDYWTDPLKLQKQVDFLEANPDYSFCCHRFKIFDERSNIWKNEYSHSYYKNKKFIVIDKILFLQTWITQPLTAIYRAKYLAGITQYSNYFSYYRDVHMFYYLLCQGKGASLNDIMGVYRWHEEGIDTGMNDIIRAKTAYMIYKELFFKSNDSILKAPYIERLLNYYSIENDKFTKDKLLSECQIHISKSNIFFKLLKKNILKYIRFKQ